MADGRQHAEAALRATTILSATAFSWFGHTRGRVPAKVAQALGSRGTREFLVDQLASTLYDNLYCRGAATPANQHGELAPVPPRGKTPLAAAMSAANSGRGCWQSGWVARDVHSDRVAASREGLTLWLEPDECRIERSGYLRPGAEIAVHMPKELFNVSPGFYMVVGNVDLDDAGERAVARFYWHLTPSSAVAFVGQATARLNEAQLRFRLKVLNDPSQFNRCDAGVLYVAGHDYPEVVELLHDVYAHIAAGLRFATPAFTRPLVPGLAVAEDPGGGASFGEHRCRLLADAIVSAHEQGRSALADRLQVVVDRFEQDHLSLDRPHLGAGSRDVYRWPRETE